MNIVETLQNLDLSRNEALVYTELLKRGLTNVGPIVNETRLHRQMVYEALKTLEEKGFTTYVIKNNRKHFQASNPNILLKREQEKQDQAKNVVAELLKIQSHAEDYIEVKTLYGSQSFFENLKIITESAARGDSIMRIIGGAPDKLFYETLGGKYDNYTKLLANYNVKKYLISPTHSSDEFKQKFANEPGNILKTMDQGLYSPTYTRITNEMISIEIYTKTLVIVQIYNQAIAKGYREHFELLWKQAKEYKKTTSD